MAWQFCCRAMCKILYRYDTLQLSYTKYNFPSNLNYDGKNRWQIGPLYGITGHCVGLSWQIFLVFQGNEVESESLNYANIWQMTLQHCCSAIGQISAWFSGWFWKQFLWFWGRREWCEEMFYLAGCHGITVWLGLGSLVIDPGVTVLLMWWWWWQHFCVEIILFSALTDKDIIT